MAGPTCAPPLNPSSRKFTFPSTPACWILQIASTTAGLIGDKKSLLLLQEVTVPRRPSLWRLMSNENQSRFPEPSNAMESAQLADHEVSDDISIGYGLSLDHASTTSHGTYLDSINEGLEPLEEYQKGGYHPIHLGDTLGSSGRYRVIHKLGHGGLRTVWLCRDLQSPRYVAVKVMMGNTAPETIPDLTLTKLDQSAPDAEYVAIPLDAFSIAGPNGSHQCIVLPVLGPWVSPRLWLSLKDPAPVLRKMAYQSTLAMNFLHKQ